MRHRLNWILTACIAVAGLLAVAGCNTFEGLGKDVKSLGSNIEDKAAEKK
jgi:predicted small secreted protein